MKHAAVVFASLALVAAGRPVAAAAQLPGMPVWNSPRGGTGFLVAGDVGIPDSTLGKGTTFAARAALGLSALTLSATAGVRNPSGAGSNDHARVLSPREAIVSGGDYIVVGRPITDASDPAAAARSVLTELS